MASKNAHNQEAWASFEYFLARQEITAHKRASEEAVERELWIKALTEGGEEAALAQVAAHKAFGELTNQRKIRKQPPPKYRKGANRREARDAAIAAYMNK